MSVPSCSILHRHIPYVGVDWAVDMITCSLNKLSAAQVKNFGPGKYSDGGGLWLHKREDGGAQWFLRVTVHRRRREMGLSAVPDVSPKEIGQVDKRVSVVTHRRTRLNTLFHLPNSAGNSCHCALVRTIQRTASTNSRGSRSVCPGSVAFQDNTVRQ